MRIVHCADLHLGRRRLHGALPESDFADALKRIVERAIAWKAQAFLIAGDLFDAPQIAPPVLRVAAACLAPLKKAKIPAIAIEGNHDRASFATSQPTWVRYLAEDGLLTLLGTPFGPEGPRLTEYDPKSGEGAILVLDKVRFVGAGYLGAGTERKVRAIAEALPSDGTPTVLLLHAGPEYFVGQGGGFGKETLALLRERISYLALGHIHKPMIHREDGGRPWALNPGSPENCHLDEADIQGPRGWAEVDILPDALPGLALRNAEIVDCPRRPLVSLEIDVTPFGNKLKEGPAAIEAEAVKKIQAKRLAPETVVRLFLAGDLNIGRVAIEPLAMGAAICAQAGVAAVEVNLGKLKLFTGRPSQERVAEGLSTAEIEKLALQTVLSEKPLDGLEERSAEVAEFYRHLKDLIAQGAAPEAILEALETSPLPAQMARELEKALF